MTTLQTGIVQPLMPDDVRHLRLPWSSPFDRPSLVEHLHANPRRSFWVPQTGEYVIGEPWRHREIVTAVVDIVAREQGRALIGMLRDPAQSVPHDLLVVTDFANARRPAFYRDLDLTLLQEVICYELRSIPPEPTVGRLRFARLDLDDDAAMDTLLRVDHASFPWLWWNTAAEFINYGRVPGVGIYVGRNGAGRPVAYFGITRYQGWGHLDRIGVVPEVQGEGYGLESLRVAVQMLARSGAHRIGLSTQATNLRSQQLYHRFGFVRTYQNDYHIYGAWVNPERAATAFSSEKPEASNQ